MLSIPHFLSSPTCFSRRTQCFWSAGTYHSKPCIMVMFSGVGSRGSEVLAMLVWEVS